MSPGPAATPTLGGVPTKPGGPAPKKKTAKVKARRSKKSTARAVVPVALHDPVNQPQLAYDRGPFELPIEVYDYRVWARRSDAKVLTMDELEQIQWDESSPLMTGSVTLREPEWAHEYGIVDGNQLVCECRREGGAWEGLWTMRVVNPQKSYDSKQRSFQLANGFQALVDSTDSFKFTKGKRRPNGWRVDEVIRHVFAAYGIEVAPGGIPAMKTRITNWTLIDQRPYDVVTSALAREKNMTGRKYALRLDAQGRALVTPFRRPKSLYQIGVTLLSAAYSVARNPKFATALTVTSWVTTTSKDKRGRKKVTYEKTPVSLSSAGAMKRYGYIHRNLYSPDADTPKEARDEGAMFLSAVARTTQQVQVTMPAMPHLRRLDAVRFVLPAEKLSQVVYVTEASHAVSGGSAVTTAVWSFDDPFVDRKEDRILSKLSETAIVRQRKTAAVKPVAKPTPKKAKARGVAATSRLGNVATAAAKPTKTGAR